MIGAVSHRVRRVLAFAELGPGELGLIVDADGHLSVVCDRQPAATVLGVQAGDVVMVRVVASSGGSPRTLPPLPINTWPANARGMPRGAGTPGATFVDGLRPSRPR